MDTRMMPSDSNTDISLLLDTSETIREIARILKSDGAKESRHFYSSIMAHCLVIQSHILRIRSFITNNHQLVVSILLRFEATIKTRILETQPLLARTAYPRLWALNEAWKRLRYDSSTIKQKFILQSIDFGHDPDQPDKLIEFFENWEDNVSRQCPDDPDIWSRHSFAPQSKDRGQPSYIVWNASRSLFQALLESKDCGCQPMHDFGVRLCLGTFRKLPEVEKEAGHHCGFEIFLSMKKEWHEADVHFLKSAAVTFIQNDVPITKKKKSRPMEVKNLCEPIRKRKPFDRIKLRVDDNGRLWKLRSEMCRFTIDETKTPVSLQQFIRDQYQLLTDKTKRILAVILGYSVLHFYGTPWLPPSWGPSSILFFRTTSAAIPLKPFIQTQLVQNSINSPQTSHPIVQDAEDAEDPDDIILHECPDLITLGIILMELYLATTFEDLADKYNVRLTGGRYIDAEMVFEACKAEIPENSQFRYAVEKCLDPTVWEDENGMRLDDQTLRKVIYQQVVGPLEDELSQAFSYIPIDDLDSIAQTLDLGNWGQTIQDQQVVARPSQHLEGGMSTGFNGMASINDEKHLGQQHQQYLTYLQGLLQLGASAVMPILPVPQTISMPHEWNFGQPDYRCMKFFDDETVSEEHSAESCINYSIWRSRFKEVYQKYITQPPKSRVKIALLDTGIDQTHPDIDACAEQIRGQYNWTNEKFINLVSDHNGHGTFTASLLLDYSPDAELYIGKISDSRPCSPSIIAKAIDYAVEQWKVDIISMSFGFPSRDVEGYDELESAIHNAYSAHVLLFAAASNSGANLDRAYPARDENVICIHSTDANGNRSPFSPTALSNALNLATVGEAVESAWPVHLCETHLAVKRKSGTSYATPIAVAIAVFLLQYVRLYLPENAYMLKRQSRMKAVLRKISEKSLESRPRDDYHFVALNRYSDNLFGKDQEFINYTLRDLLNH